MVGIDHCGLVDYIHFLVHIMEADEVFVVVVGRRVAVLADGPAQDNMRQRIAGRLDLVAAVDEVMRMLGGIYGIQYSPLVGFFMPDATSKPLTVSRWCWSSTERAPIAT